MANPRALLSLSLSVVLALSLQSCLIPEVKAETTKKTKPKPSGTVLLPLTPRIDDGTHTPQATPESSFTPVPSPLGSQASSFPSSPPSSPSSAKQIAQKLPKASANDSTQNSSAQSTTQPSLSDSDSKPSDQSSVAGSISSDNSSSSKQSADESAASPSSPAQPNISAESGYDDGSGATQVDENSVLKGTVQITADDTEFDQDKNTFLGTGNAVCLIAGQNSKLEADTILYDQDHGTIDARGNVKILRDGQLTTGESIKFKVDSDEYLITSPDTELSGTTIVAQTSRGLKSGIKFRNGDFTLPQPLHIMNNGFYGPVSTSERAMYVQQHPEAYVPTVQSYKFTARKMIYERYKNEGNLTVYGGKVIFDNFTVPLPKFVCNINNENPRVIFPVTPFIGNNMMVGGTNIGPQFNYAVGKTGEFSWAPLLQLGGVSKNSTGTTSDSNTGKIGAGFKVSYSNDVLSTHLGYGTVSNLMVADFKYRFSKKTVFQSGINRFTNDGLFGMRRPRLIAEVVDNRGISTIPYIGYLNFRTSGGWAQDDPALIGLSGSNYSRLFKPTGSGKVSAYRVQEQISASTHPIFSLGNAKYGADMMLAGGLALRGYSTGNSMVMAQAGPLLNTHLGRFRGRFGYMQSAVRGSSPFVFDQFIQGQQSVYFQGDYRLSKWLTLGTNLGYNMNTKLMYTRAITAAVGPDDLKVLFTRDTISGYQRMGFDILYGSPVKFNSLLVKGGADAGTQYAGIGGSN